MLATIATVALTAPAMAEEWIVVKTQDGSGECHVSNEPAGTGQQVDPVKYATQEEATAAMAKVAACAK